MAETPVENHRRHGRENFFVRGEGILALNAKGKPIAVAPSQAAEQRKFLFSRLGPKGKQLPRGLLEIVGAAMTAPAAELDMQVAAGYTYLGQFVDHDLTFDRTAVKFGADVTLEQLNQGRSPALDLDSMYGGGPTDPLSADLYSDGARFKMGKSLKTGFPLDGRANVDLDGHDLPRRSPFGSTKAERQKAILPDPRNDENLAVAQTHVALMNFHQRVVDRLASTGTPSTALFATARELVTKHYQWMLKTDYLPKMVDPAIVDDVFTHGRKSFEVSVPPGDMPTMPIEFSVAAFRFGHTMVREHYEWNFVFKAPSGPTAATLLALFTFSGTSGNFDAGSNLDIPNTGSFEGLPSNWVADWRRLFDFTPLGQANLDLGPGETLNLARRIDTKLVDPLAKLPTGSFGGFGTAHPAIELNLAFRNLMRAGMVALASGQQMAAQMGITPLSADEILNGKDGAVLDGLSSAQAGDFTANTPLWFYILREAELAGGILSGVGGRLVAEVLHRAMEGSVHSIVRDPAWKPNLGPRPGTFEMIDLLHFAFNGDPRRLNPMGS